MCWMLRGVGNNSKLTQLLHAIFTLIPYIIYFMFQRKKNVIILNLMLRKEKNNARLMKEFLGFKLPYK